MLHSKTITAICLASLMCTSIKGEEWGGWEYKDIYMPENISPHNHYNLNHVDTDWGIWGHNLYRVIGKNIPDEAMAMSNGERDGEQLCFSSDFVHRKISDYIKSEFSSNTPQRFVIMPYDNTIACCCEKCKALGNKPGNATPAVTNLIMRLCREFPAHTFYTSYYMSTAHLPAKPLPANAGVLISAIDWPLRSVQSSKGDKFKTLLTEWKTLTDRIYIWDYICNFDDYFTPLPTLSIMQQRIQLYANTGVKGLFLNGSGDRYCIFSDLTTYVLQGLMADPQKNWETLAKGYLNANYPISGNLIAEYIISLEEECARRGKQLQYYAGTHEAIKEYLDTDRFSRFYQELAKMQPKLTGNEASNVSKMLAALSLTRLEIARIQNEDSNPSIWINSLRQATKYPEMQKYNETGWTVADYIRDYTQTDIPKNDILRGCRFKALTALDEDYTDTRILTDGKDALPSNYHCGWLVSSIYRQLELYVDIPADKTTDKMKLSISLLHSPKYRFTLPEAIEVWSNSAKLATIRPTLADTTDKPAKINAETTLNLKDKTNLTIKLIRKTGRKSLMGIGEITLKPQQI